MEKSLSIGALAVAALALVLSLWPSTPTVVGGDIYNKVIDVQGLTVNGSSFVSNGKAITAAAITATSQTVVNGTVTSTIAAGSSAIGTNKGKLCVWNGSNYSIISFTANTTSTSISTSTSCQ